LTRPALTLPEAASAHKVAFAAALNDPHPETLQMPRAEIGGQPSPRGACRQRATVLTRGLGIGVEALIELLAGCAGRQQHGSCGRQRWDLHDWYCSGLTFDVRGVWKRAKPVGTRPLDGRVKRLLRKPDTSACGFRLGSQARG